MERIPIFKARYLGNGRYNLHCNWCNTNEVITADPAKVYKHARGHASWWHRQVRFDGNGNAATVFQLSRAITKRMMTGK